MASMILGSTAWVAQAAPQEVGRNQLYDENGDLVFQTSSEALATLNNRTHWRAAAYCVALNNLVDYSLDEMRAKASKKGKTFDESKVPNTYRLMEQENLRWREFAMHRLRIDHPRGSNFDTSFDAEVSAQMTALHALDWTHEEYPWSTRWGTRAGACGGYRTNIEGLVYNMQNGRGAGSRGAPGS